MAQPPPDMPGLPALELLARCDGFVDLFRGRLSPGGPTAVVLKVVRQGLVPDAELLGRFYGEAHLLSRLRHPHVVRLVEVGDADGLPYLILEDVAGGDLADRMQRGPLAPVEAARIVEKVAGGLHHVHERGVVVRGLSLRAVRFSEAGEPKLFDFSLAQQRHPAGPDEPAAIVGTPIYMAPEQVASRGCDIGPRTDVYALGAVLYTLLTGRPPFRGDSPVDTLVQVLDAEAVPPRRLRPQVPAELDAICLRCLEKEPEQRYPSAAVLADDLHRFLCGERLPRGGLWGRVRRALFRRPDKVATPPQPAPGPAPAAEEQATVYARQLALAQAMCLGGDSGQARELLLTSTVVLRGWEWHYLQRRAGEGPLVLRGHRGAATSLSFHPESKHLASGGGEGNHGEVKVWRLRDGKEVVAFTPAEEVTCVAFSADGKSLACGGVERRPGTRCGVLRVWEVELGKEAWGERRAGMGVTALAYHPDGLMLASAACGAGSGLRDPEGRLRGASELGLRELTNRRASSVFQWLNGSMHGVAFGPGGKVVAFATGGSCDPAGQRVWPGKVQVRSVPENNVLFTFAGDARQGFGPLAFSATGNYLAAGAADLRPPDNAPAAVEVVVWDLLVGFDIHHLRGHAGPITGVAFHPDGHRLASASADCTVKIWDVVAGRELLTLRDHAAPLTAVAFSPDGHRLAAAAADGAVLVWDATPTPEGSAVDHPSDSP